MKPTKTKARRIAIMFFVVGVWGLGVSYIFAGNPNILVLSVINLGLGILFTLYYTKAKK